MQTLFRTYICFVIVFFFLLTCSHLDSSPSFEFTAHHLKVQIDPDSHHFIAVDTISISYHKNVESFYFFLHDSLTVERVGVGHQEFQIEPMRPRELKTVLANMNRDQQQWAEHSQIVKIRIPKSLYAEHIEIRYKGSINPESLDQVIWHPALPDAIASYELMVVVPKDYHIQCNATLRTEQTNEYWRFCEWEQMQPGPCLSLKIRPTHS